MFKRVLLIFCIFMLSMMGLCVRIADISQNTVQVGKSVSTKYIDLATLKGTIYDCNLKPITNAENDIFIAAKPSNRAIAVLKDVLLPEVFESIKERMAKGKPVAVKSETAVENSEDIKCIYVPERYGEGSFACHIVGYTDGENNGVSGIEKAYNTLLSSEIKIPGVRFSADANGRALMGETITVEDNEIPKTGVVLTIDTDIQKTVETALDNSGMECGAAVVMDIKSGAIRACVSRPAFDRENISASLNDKNSPLINRAFLPFSVGSVFKPVVAAAALENGVEKNFVYNCTGNVTFNGVIFNCHKRSGHGVLDMENAVANSCNTYFIALAHRTGAENIIETAKKFGFGKEVFLAEGIKSASGYLPETEELDSKAALANLSFGQGSLTATPVQICSMMSTIANRGIAVKPYIIEGETDSAGNYIKKELYKERTEIMSEDTAVLLMKYLRSVVVNGSGRNADSKILKTAGKTATAQTGKIEDGKELYNSWFAGYFPADNPEYAVVIMREKGEGGSADCAPVFRMIAETVYIVKNEKPGSGYAEQQQ